MFTESAPASAPLTLALGLRAERTERELSKLVRLRCGLERGHRRDCDTVLRDKTGGRHASCWPCTRTSTSDGEEIGTPSPAVPLWAPVGLAPAQSALYRATSVCQRPARRIRRLAGVHDTLGAFLGRYGPPSRPCRPPPSPRFYRSNGATIYNPAPIPPERNGATIAATVGGAVTESSPPRTGNSHERFLALARDTVRGTVPAALSQCFFKGALFPGPLFCPVSQWHVHHALRKRYVRCVSRFDLSPLYRHARDTQSFTFPRLPTFRGFDSLAHPRHALISTLAMTRTVGRQISIRSLSCASSRRTVGSGAPLAFATVHRRYPLPLCIS